MTVFIDTLETSEVLKEGGFKEPQAKALIKAFSPHSGSIVSKKDLDIAVEMLKNEMDSAINKLKAQLVAWMVGLQIANAALVVSLLG